LPGHCLCLPMRRLAVRKGKKGKDTFPVPFLRGKKERAKVSKEREKRSFCSIWRASAETKEESFLLVIGKGEGRERKGATFQEREKRTDGRLPCGSCRVTKKERKRRIMFPVRGKKNSREVNTPTSQLKGKEGGFSSLPLRTGGGGGAAFTGGRKAARTSFIVGEEGERTVLLLSRVEGK